jgi:hypothetical protein
LLQLRLAEPRVSKLITGVKRDIQLLQQVPANLATSVTVLDISMEKNLAALAGLLAQEIDVLYIDHHRTGLVPNSEHLTEIIDTDANTCTSLLVNQHLAGQYALWAIVAAFGDNMLKAAEQLSQQAGLSAKEQDQLKALGIYINYNGYGRTVDDLHIAPDALFTTLLNYPDPFTLINEANSIFTLLEQAYLSDMTQAKQANILHDDETLQVIELEDAPWSRRVSGVYGNELANQNPDKAHAVFTLNLDNTYTVSLRAPINNKLGAGELCAQFETGGGRAAAAGVNQLPKEKLGNFIALVSKYYQ